MKAFTYDTLPGRVVFGVGAIAGLPDEVERLGASRVLIVTDPMTKPVADELAEHLGGRFAAVFSDVQQHVPIEAVRQAREVAERSGADCVVTVGGGSTTGFGKAIALHTGIPTIAVPTTTATTTPDMKISP